MSKEIKNITENIMEQIRGQKIKMKPRAYFVAGSALVFVGLVSSVVVSVFLVGLMRFSLRAQGPMAGYRLGYMMNLFPWWALFFAMIGLLAGMWLLRKYDFSFKIDFKIIAAGLILAVLVGGWIVDSMGLNDMLLRRGPMRGWMRQYLEENNLPGGAGGGQGWRSRY